MSSPRRGHRLASLKPEMHLCWASPWTVFRVTLTCPHCNTDMKIIAVITQNEPIHKILNHLKSKKIDPRAGPFADVAA